MLLLAERYQLLEPLRSGGMAQLYVAHDRALDRRVAVKRIKPELAHDATFRKQCLYEARTLAALRHPNVVEIFDCGDDEGRPYLVLELIEGQTLDDLLPLPPPQALHYLLQTAAALAFCHAQGIVHADIKPSNIMITNGGNVKLIDFGIACPEGELMDGPLVGSPHYVSPERVLGKPLLAASDIYSFGIVLFQMITGQVPFNGPDAASIAHQHVSELVPLMSEVLLSVPLSLDRVVARATAQSPLARYRNGTALLQALYQTRHDLLGVPIPQLEPVERSICSATALWEKATGLIERPQLAAA
ncbi:MAG: serine/threonine protein kinase [Herpetosiphonaceae bacterium]|nr:serine/threonine protein kinase [Herpetosiphonaceae bacterium]